MIRREFMIGLGAGTTGALMLRSKAVLAMGEEAELITLSDGNLVLPGDFVIGDLPTEDAARILADYGLDTETFTPDCNVTLLRTADRLVLFDAGAGMEFMGSAGQLPDSLAAAGVDPYDVTDIVFTHAHPDHIWGVLDDFGDLISPDATYHLGAIEMDHWTNPDLVTTIAPDRQSFAVGAARRIEAIEPQVRRFNDGDEVLPGVMARATFGHTPGHMAFEVAVGGEEVMVLGDCIGNHHLAFERPEWPSGSDEDKETGIATRVALLDELASREVMFIGFHLPTPGIGRAERRDGGSYAFIAAEG